MEMVLSNGLVALNPNELLIVDGGADGWYEAGEAVGMVLGIVWDIAVVVRAVYTGSWV